VRPIHQASGGREFNEVYFTDVRIPDSWRLGDPGMGWNVALVTLMNERLAVGGSYGPDYAEIFDFAKSTRLSGEGTLIQDESFRQKLADWIVKAEGYKLAKFRTMTALSKGQTPGPESSIGKVINANQMMDIANTAIERMDHYGIINDPDLAPLEGAFHQELHVRAGLAHRRRHR
jgi:alkylation response protein AidB-like acyl-CoA dehydrogenase